MHCCCAPCATYPLFLLRAGGHEVHALFVNPNIYPMDEWRKRWDTLREFASKRDVRVQCLGAPHAEWLSSVSKDLTKPGRCRLCYENRLAFAAKFAAEGGYDAFTTTLLASIYQDHEGVVEAGEEAGRLYDVPFLNVDWRPGYRRGREMARGLHMYMQKYCGCEFSLQEGHILQEGVKRCQVSGTRGKLSSR